MKSNEFYLLDVFAEKKYAGNQLAVVIAKNALTDSEMQQIAREINFSETTFILSDKVDNGGYGVRIFTPAQEVPFAGHPTLGAAYVIQREIIRKRVDRVVLNLKAGQIPVALRYGMHGIERLTMRQLEPTFGGHFEKNEIAEILTIQPSDIDERHPLEEVSTGLPFIIVPLKHLDAVKRARIHQEKYRALIRNREAKAIFIFCPEPYNKENHLNARMFADHYGIPEDPATGSANGCLAGYLVKHRYFGQDRIDIRVEQGYEIGRPSLLYLQAMKKRSTIEIHVGGNVIEVAKGAL
jgi:trans-2,3-dihydro-3-hydroxyanthranilate isomerase